MKLTSRSTIAFGIFALMSGVVAAQSGNDLFQQALVKERIEGNLTEVIALYEKIVQQHGSDRKLAAKALYQMGQAYEKLGQAEARKAYERIARDFADQKEVAADAGRRLAVLSGGASSNVLQTRAVQTPGNATDVTVSFDGRWMTANVRSRENNQIVVQDIATGEAKRWLTTSAVTSSKDKPNETWRVWPEIAVLSPDAKLVAYSWFDGADLEDNTRDEAWFATLRCELHVIANEPGATPRVLVRNREFFIYTVAWSPDAKSILVRLVNRDRTAQFAWVSVAGGEVKILKSIEELTNGGRDGASLSPDGRYIAYATRPTSPSKTSPAAANSTDRHIHLLAADGSSEVALVTTAAVNKFPVWTPDGSQVIFRSNLSGKTDLWSVAVRNGKAAGSPNLLKRDIGDIWPMGMTKAGSYYYQDFGGRAGVEEVFVAEFTAGGGARILESFVGFDPAWSPDGKALAFKRHSTRTQNRSNVVVRSVETGQEKTSSRDITMVPLHWLHDSTRFLTLADTDHEGGVPWWHIVDLTKNTFSRATPGRRGRAMIGAISPDDKTLYTAAGEPSKFNGFDRIIAVDLATGQEREVLRFTGTPELSGGGGVGIAISPDGRSLAVATTNNKKPTEARLFRVDVDGGNYRELHGPYRANHTAFVLVWTKDGRSIVFATSVGGRNWNNKSEIMRIGSAGGSPESTGLTIDNLRAFDLSPDGSRIAYSRNAQTLASAPMFYAIDNLPALLKGAK